MKLNMQILADELIEITTEKGALLNKELTLDFVRAVRSGNTTEKRPNVIFVGSDEDFLNENEFCKIVAAIYYGTTPIREMPFDCSAEILRVTADIQCVDLLHLINDIFHKYHCWKAQLQQALLDNTEIHSIAEIASICFHNPFAIVDNSGYCLTWNGNMPENYKNPLWDVILGSGYAYDADYTKKYGTLWDDDSHMKREAYITSLIDEKPPYQTLIKNIFVGQQRKGNIGMTNAIKDFSDGQCRLSEYFADEILSRYFVRNQESNVENDRRDVFLANSILESPLQNKELAIMLKDFGIDDTKLLRLIIVSPLKQQMLSLLQAEYYLKRLREHRRPGEMIIGDSKRMVIVSPWLADFSDLKNRLSEYKSLFNGKDITIGASTSFFGHEFICYHFEQACIALDYGQKFKPKERLYSYLDFSVAHMIDEYKNKHSSKMFCHPIVKTLHDYDMQNKTEYLNTLEALYIHAGNQVNTATSLHIHRNSLNYRLKKMLDILDICEFPKDATLHIMMSCQMMRNV